MTTLLRKATMKSKTRRFPSFVSAAIASFTGFANKIVSVFKSPSVPSASSVPIEDMPINPYAGPNVIDPLHRPIPPRRSLRTNQAVIGEIILVILVCLLFIGGVWKPRTQTEQRIQKQRLDSIKEHETIQEGFDFTEKECEQEEAKNVEEENYSQEIQKPDKVSQIAMGARRNNFVIEHPDPDGSISDDDGFCEDDQWKTCHEKLTAEQKEIKEINIRKRNREVAMKIMYSLSKEQSDECIKIRALLTEDQWHKFIIVDMNRCPKEQLVVFLERMYKALVQCKKIKGSISDDDGFCEDDQWKTCPENRTAEQKEKIRAKRRKSLNPRTKTQNFNSRRASF